MALRVVATCLAVCSATAGCKLQSQTAKTKDDVAPQFGDVSSLNYLSDSDIAAAFAASADDPNTVVDPSWGSNLLADDPDPEADDLAAPADATAAVPSAPSGLASAPPTGTLVPGAPSASAPSSSTQVTGVVPLPTPLPTVSALALDETLPASVDFRKSGWVTPVKDQGQHPSCTVFAINAAIESSILMSNPGTVMDLSEANLWYMQGQQPTTIDLTLRVATSNMVTTEQYWPYTMLSQRPAGNIPGVIRISGVGESPKSVYTMKQMLAAGTPMTMAIQTSDTFMRASHGVVRLKGMKANNGEHSHHAVEVVGYKDVASVPGGGYFIVKNSWGTAWGDHGFGYLPYAYCAVPGFDDCHARAVPGWTLKTN